MRWICLTWCLLGFALAQSPAPVSIGPSGLRFEPAGPLPSGVEQYLGRGADASLLIESDGFRLHPRGAGQPIQARFVGASPSATLHGADPLPSRSHYLRGDDPVTWRSNVPHYGRVRVEALYPGVELVYYPAANGVEFDLTLEPAADLRLLRMRFSGVGELRIDDEGAVLLGAGGHTVRQLRPRVFQTRGGERREIAARYVLAGDREVGFELDDYDDSLPLLIDPVLEWATFLGGSGQDQVNAVAVDVQGSVYAAGFTGSANFAASNAMDGELSGLLDGFVSKLSPDGTQLVWSTYFGGSLRDEIRGMRLDAAGNIYVSGATESTDFPTTAGAAQRTPGGAIDAFVAKLSPDGSSLVYSTLFGAAGVENGRKLAVDAAGAAYVTGEVSGTEFPATNGAFQTQNGGGFDAFLAKINAAGSAVEWATYFGGNGLDLTFDLVADPSGGVLLGGGTNSTDFPGTANAFQRTIAGLDDGYVARFGSDGAVDYFSYIGGTGTDQVRGLAPDGNGNVWIAGGTGSQNFPTTANAPNRGFLGGPTDGFLARLPLPSRIVPGPPVTAPLLTYVGDEIQNYGLAIALASGAQAAALSAAGARQAFGEFIFYSLSNFTPADGSFGRVIEFGPDGMPGDIASIVGADGSSLATDPLGNVIIVGGIGLTNAQTTPGAVQPSHGGGTGTQFADGFVAGFVPKIAEPQAMLQIEKKLRSPIDLQVPGLPAGTETTLDFEITVTNVGAVDARDVVVSDEGDNLNILRLLSGFLFGAGPGGQQLSCPIQQDVDTDMLTCSVGVLPPGARVSLFLRTGPKREGNYRNRAVATAANAALVAAEISGVVADTELQVTKELIEPASGPVGPGTLIRHRITVTNVGPVDAVDVQVHDLSSYRVNSVDIERNPAGVSCAVNRRVGYGIGAYCKREILSPGDSFSVIVTGTTRLNSELAENQVQAEALNAPKKTVDVAIPVGEQPTSEPVLCTGKFVPIPEDFQGAQFAPVVLGENSLRAPLPRADTTCWVNQQPSGDAIPAQVSVDLNVDPVNPVGSGGGLSYSVFTLTGPNGESIPLPVRRGTGSGSVQTDTFSGPVVNRTFSGGFSGLRIDATRLSSPTDLRAGFRISSPALPNGSVEFNTTTQVETRREVFTATFSEPGPDGSVKITLNLTEGFPNAWTREADANAKRIVASIEGLPSNAVAGPIAACLTAPTNLGAEARRVTGADANGQGGAPSSTCETFTPPLVDGRITGVFELLGFDPVTDGTVRNILMPFQVSGVGNGVEVGVRAGLGPQLPAGADPASFPLPLYRSPLAGTFTIGGAAEVISTNGVVDAAGNGTLGPGLGALYGNGLADNTDLATQLPLPLELNGVRVLVTPVDDQDFAGLREARKPLEPPVVGQAIGAFAPLLFVSPGQINFQLPWEIDLSSGFVDLTVYRNGVAAAPARVPVSVFSPAAFTFDFGPGRAVAINPDGSVAHPEDSFDGAVASRPARRGEALVILANGLGPVDPPAETGFNSLDDEGGFIRRDTVETPRVTIGGVEQQLLFSGMSPEFAGVYQLNVLVGEGTPAGEELPLILEIGGVRSRGDVTIAVGP